MAISDFYNKTATLHKLVTESTNDYGEPIHDETTSSFECAFQPDDGEFEISELGKRETSTHRLYCSTIINIEVGDFVTVDEIKYKVLFVGDDAGRGHHLLCRLRVIK